MIFSYRMKIKQLYIYSKYISYRERVCERELDDGEHDTIIEIEIKRYFNHRVTVKSILPSYDYVTRDYTIRTRKGERYYCQFFI